LTLIFGFNLQHGLDEAYERLNGCLGNGNSF